MIQSRRSLGKIYNIGSSKEITILILQDLLINNLIKVVLMEADVHSSQQKAAKSKQDKSYNKILSENSIEIGLKKQFRYLKIILTIKEYKNNMIL